MLIDVLIDVGILHSITHIIQGKMTDAWEYAKQIAAMEVFYINISLFKVTKCENFTRSYFTALHEAAKLSWITTMITSKCTKSFLLHLDNNDTFSICLTWVILNWKLFYTLAVVNFRHFLHWNITSDTVMKSKLEL